MSIELHRVKREYQFQNGNVISQGSILEEPILSWASLSRKLKEVPDNTNENNDLTSLGSDMGFMAPFVLAFSDYSEQYSEGSWGRADDYSANYIDHTDLVFPDNNTKDPSFAQKVVLPDNTNVIFIGDIHSSLQSIVDVIDNLVGRGILSDNLLLKKGYFIVFLGDIFDRGPFGLDILNIIIRIKNNNYGKCVITNGNHEDYSMYFRDEQTGTGTEIETQLETQKDMNLIHNLMLFLPTVLFLSVNGKWFHCCHGGIHIGYDPIKFIKSKYEFDFHGYDSGRTMVNMGLRWNDFGTVLEDELSNGTAKSPRGGKTFTIGIEHTNKYLKRNEIEGIIRGHQDMVHYQSLPRSLSQTRNLPESDDSLLYIPADHLHEKSIDSWERIFIPDAFRDFSVLTTSTANRARGLGYNTYLELVSKVDMNVEILSKIKESGPLMSFIRDLKYPLVSYIVDTYKPEKGHTKKESFYKESREVVEMLRGLNINEIYGIVAILEGMSRENTGKKLGWFKRSSSA